jgi:hypothetical protein
MEKEIIKLPISEIKNNFLSYNLNFSSDGTVVCEKIHTNIFLYFTLFLIIGLPLTILSPYKTFNFFHKKTNLDPLDPKIYSIGGGKIMKRIVLTLIYFILLILYPYICFFNLSFFDSEVDSYDWAGLYEKIILDGYQPKTNSYIRVYKYKNDYICIDGNHRHKILETFYPKDKIIDVIYEGQVFDK